LNLLPFICVSNNIKFILSEEISKEWNKADVWISDSKRILDLKPESKEFILFETTYNNFFTYDKKINKLSDIIIDNQNNIIFNKDEQKLLNA
jgi:hypothetical protein